MTQNNTSKQPENTSKSSSKRPNETGSISVEGFVKIFDPNTRETYVEKRA